MKREFTATVYIVSQDKVLLIFHRKLQRWLPPGGHIEEDETPPETAKREAFEETGLTIELMSDENIWNYKSLERPYLCALHEVPQFGMQPAHQHIDMIYVGYPTGGFEKRNPLETEKMRWFSLSEIEQLSEEETFSDTQEVIRKIFSDLPILPCR